MNKPTQVNINTQNEQIDKFIEDVCSLKYISDDLKNRLVIAFNESRRTGQVPRRLLDELRREKQGREKQD